MITLHNEKETNFRRNGYGVLDDLFNTAPQGSWELNGEFKISFEVPFFADVEKTSHLVNGNILQVPVPHMERQLFRIYRSEKSLGYVQGEARHIFYDLLDNFIEDTNIQNQPGNNAIQQILNNTVYGHRFTGSSNINDRNANARVVRMNPVEAILDDGRSNSFVSRWGGELVRNNFDIEMLQQRGSDNGVTIRHRENLMGYHATIDRSTVVTRIRPVGFDGLTLPELYVDSPLMDEEHPIIMEYEFRDVKAAIGEYAEDEDAIPLEDAYDELRRLAEEEFSVHHVDEPESTIDVDFIQLKNMVGYEDLQEIQEVKAGDTLTVEVPDEDFNLTSRLVAFEWNPLIEDEYTNTTLGNHVREFTSSNQGQDFQRDLEEVQEQVIQAMQAANGRNTNWRGDANPNDLDLDDWDGLRLGDYYTQSNGEHYIVYQFVEVAGERYFTELINTAHTDEASRRVEEAISEAQDAKAQVERESEERRADIQAESERLSSEWNERIEENEQIVEGVRHSTEELMNDFDRALTQENFTSIEDLTTTLNTRSLEAIEIAERADGHAIEALDVANGFGTRMTDVESTVEGQVTSINTAIATAERVEQELTRVEETAEGARVIANRVEETAEGFERTISEVSGDVDDLSSRFVSMEADIEGITNTVSDYEGRISRTEQRADGLYDVVHDPNTGLLTEVGQIAEGWQVTAQRIDDLGGRNYFYVNELLSRENNDRNLPRIELELRPNTEYTVSTTDVGRDTLRDVFATVDEDENASSGRNGVVLGRPRTLTTGSDGRLWVLYRQGNRNSIINLDPRNLIQVERGSVATDWSPAPEDMATQAQLSVLHNAIDLAVEEGDVVGRLNIQAGHTLIQNGEILMDADTVRFTGSAFIPNAAIEELTADKITGTQGAFSELFSKLFEAEQVTADHIDVDTQFVDMLFGVSGFFERLVADAAFVEEFQASNIEIDGGRVHGTLNGNSLDFVNIDVNSLSGNLSEFVSTQWNNAVGGNTSIDGNGITTTQNPYSMRFGSGLITAESGSSFLEISPLAIYGSANTGRWEVSAAGLVFRDNSLNGVTLASNGTSYHYRNSNIATLVAAPFVNDANSIGFAIETQSGGRMAEIGQSFNILGHLNMRGNYIERVNRVSLEQANGGYLIGDNSNSVALLNSSGNTIKFGIGSPSSWHARMEIGGNVNYYTNLNMRGNNVSNVGNLSYNSDERLKEVVSRYEGSSLEKIKTLAFVNYYWLDRDYNDELQMGLLAQQSDCISIYDEENDRWNIDVNKQLMLVTHGLQELTVMEEKTNKVASKNYLKIEELTEWKDEKDKKIEELEARIKELEGAA